MLNSYDNPDCVLCGYGKFVGCGTKLVDNRRTHITIYNCTAGGKISCNTENCIRKKPSAATESKP